MEKFEKTYNKWREFNKKLYEDSKAYIIDCLNQLPDKSIDIDNDNQPMVCVYGRHPEYDANPFSCVSCIYLKDNNVVFDCEDFNAYPISEINAHNLYDIAHAVSLEMSNIDIEE